MGASRARFQRLLNVLGVGLIGVAVLLTLMLVSLMVSDEVLDWSFFFFVFLVPVIACFGLSLFRIRLSRREVLRTWVSPSCILFMLAAAIGQGATLVSFFYVLVHVGGVEFVGVYVDRNVIEFGIYQHDPNRLKLASSWGDDTLGLHKNEGGQVFDAQSLLGKQGKTWNRVVPLGQGIILAGSYDGNGLTRPSVFWFHSGEWYPRWGRSAYSSTHATIPYWLVFLLATLPAVRLFRRLIRRERRRNRGLCLVCGYDLTGNVSGVCPECGEKAEQCIPS